MKCNISKEEIIGYLYKEMEPAEQQALEKHLAQCPACRRELEELSQTSRLLQVWPPEEPRLQLVFVEERSLPKKSRWREWRGVFSRRHWIFGLGGAFALALMMFAIFAWDGFFGRDNAPTAGKESDDPLLEWRSIAGKNDSLGFFRQSPGENDFHHHYVFPPRPRERIRRDIDVMANIMDAALEQKYQAFFDSPGKTRGIYMDGLGAVFFLQNSGSDSADNDALHIIEELQTHKNYTFSTRYSDAWKDAQSKESWENFETALLEVVGDYSHTLRPLQPTESVVVAIDLDGKRGGYSGSPQRFLIKVKKQDLDAYNRGQIRLAEFKEKVEVQRY